MKKFIISIISTVLILASFAGITVSQAATCSASLSSATVTEGNKVTITIAFSQPVRTAGFNLKYDNTKLQYDSSSVALSSEPNGSRKVAYVSMNGSAPIQSISFTFKTNGIGAVNVTASNIEVSVKDPSNSKKDILVDVESVSSVVTINKKPDEKPKDDENTNKPGTGTGTNKPGTGTGTNKPGTGTSTNKPGTSTNTNKPSTNTNTNKPSNNTTATNNGKNNNENAIGNNEVAGNQQSNRNEQNNQNQQVSNTQTNNNEGNEVNGTNDGKNNQGTNNGKTKLSNGQIIEYSIFSIIGLIILILLVTVIIRELKQKKDEE